MRRTKNQEAVPHGKRAPLFTDRLAIKPTCENRVGTVIEFTYIVTPKQMKKVMIGRKWYRLVDQ